MDSQEYLRTNFLFATLYVGKMPLTDSYLLRKLFLAHIESPKLADSPADSFPIN